MLRRVTPVLFAILCGCSEEQPQDAEESEVAMSRVPAKTCGQVATALDELKRKAFLEHDDQGNATLPEDAWLQLGSAGQLQLATSIAIHAACAAAEPPVEQPVTIKNELGRTLTSRVVEVGASAGDLMID